MKLREIPVFVNPNAVLVLSHENLVVDMMVSVNALEINAVSKRFLDCEIKKMHNARMAEGTIWVFVELEGKPKMQDIEVICRRKAKRIQRAAKRLEWMKRELINSQEFVDLPIYKSIISQIHALEEYLVNDDMSENAFNKDDYAEGRLE
ncbi:hypothetical protein LC76P1_00019 [Lysinibacillus phage LC76P1]|nr:hypothetical protein LC76P1_00019 [Lysinibacillus phage LC76P1]